MTPINDSINTYSVPVVLPVSTKKVSKNSPNLLYRLQQLIKKIARTIASFFIHMTSSTNIKKLFRPSELRLLRDDCLRDHKKNPLANRDIIPIQPSQNNDHSNIEQIQPATPAGGLVYSVYDDSLEYMRQFCRDFSTLVVDEVHEKYLEPKLETVQNSAHTIPPVIKPIVKLLVEMGDKASKPLFQKFAQQKASVIDPALQKIFNTLLKYDQMALRDRLFTFLKEQIDPNQLAENQQAIDYIKPLINWISDPNAQKHSLENYLPKGRPIDTELMKSLAEKGREFWQELLFDEQDQLYNFLETRLKEDMKDAKHSVNRNFDKDYIRPILDWLVCTDHSAPLVKRFEPLKLYQEDLIDKVFEKAISLLIEKQIDQYANIIEKTMERRLGKIVHHMMRVNAGRVSDFFTNRFSELISFVPFKEMFDTVIHEIVAAQIQGYISAERQVQDDKALLINVKKAAQIVPKDAVELEIKAKAQNHLASIEKHGGETAFFEHVFLESFGKERACSSHTQEIIHQQIELTLQGKDPSFSNKECQKETFTKLADQILALMLPSRKRLEANGQIEEIDPFTQLWEQLYFPPEFYQLENHIKELASEFITPEATSIVTRFMPNSANIQSIFKSIVQDMLKKQLVKVIQLAFDKLTTPASLTELMGAEILPSINQQLVKIFIGQQLSYNIRTIAPMLWDILNSTGSKQEAHLLQLQTLLIEITKNKSRHFTSTAFFAEEIENNGNSKLIYTDLTDKDWLRLSSDCINKFLKKLRQVQNNRIETTGKNAPLLTKQEIATLIADNFYTPAQEPDPIYGKTIMDLMFKVGDWSNESLIKLAIKDALSADVTNSLWEIRDSHVYLINTITESLSTSYLDKKRVTQICQALPKVDPQFAEQKLAHQIALISAIMHDMIMDSANEKSFMVKFVVKPFLSDHPTKLQNLIKTIYQKIFTNQMLNENLLLRACQEVFKNMDVAAKQLRKLENIKMQKINVR